MSRYVVATRFVIALLLTVLCSSSFAANKNKRPPTSVIAGLPTLESVSDEIEALGTLKANESIDVTVHVSEIVNTIRFTEGQRVNKGDILLELESAEEKALLREANYTLEEARSQRDRIKAIAQRGDASQSLLDERQREFDVARARLAAIESKLADLVVKAPFSGLVGLRDVSPGAFLSPGDVITTLIDDTSMKLDFSVPAIYLSALEKGMRINASTPAFSDQVFVGEVASIDNRIDPVSRSVKVRATIPNPKGILKPGLLMEVTLKTNPRQALTIPEEALVPKARKYFVSTIAEKDGKTIASPTVVTIGSRWEGKVEILTGLTADQRIVIDGAEKIRPNTTVELINAAF